MREFTHPPTPGARREIASLGRPEDSETPKAKWHDFIIRVETIQKAGLIAEVGSENGYVTVYAARRSARIRRG